jgi:uncharacterized surface protein with fasciclin (FAS1) repeats
MAVLLLAAGLALPARAQAPLEWKLKKGDVFYLRNVTSTKQVLKAVGKDVPQNSEQTVVLGFTVADQTPEGLLLKETIDEVTVKPEKGEPVSDDKIAGATFMILLSPKWEVLKFEGYDKLLDKLAGDDVAVRQALQATLSEDALKKSVRELMAFLPDRPVKEGETWERTVEQPLGALGTLRETRTYKLEGKEDVGGKKVDKIGFTSAVDYKPGKADKVLAYHVVSGEMKAEEAKGTVLFDPAAGRVVQIESHMKLRGRMVLSISGSANPIDATVEQEQTTKAVVLSEKPARR